jgi:hypothetical protein
VSVWPDARQELLLRAAVGAGEPALAAWTEWRRQVDPGAVDPASRRVLPLVYRNLARQGVADRQLAELRPVYRLTWLKNQQLFRALREILATLHRAGVATLVLKGAALGPLYYEDEGARPMSDLDVLVPEAALQRAVGVLRDAGWSTFHWRPEYFDTRFEHALPLLDGGGQSLDLHCHVLETSCERDADACFWEGSVPATIQGTATRTLCPTDHLLHACVHGVLWVTTPPITWVVDALTVLARADRIDWNRLAEVARSRGATLAAAAPLEYLASHFRAPIPPAIVQRLREFPAAAAERRRYEMWMQNRRGRPGLLLRYHWSMFRRGVGSVGPLRTAAAVPAYLRFLTQTEPWRAPFVLGAKGAHLLAYRLGLYRYWDS